MREPHEAPTPAAIQYHAAQAAHVKRDLPEAFRLYMELVSSHPRTQEAIYARSQVRDIVRDVVPDEELFAAEVALLNGRLGGRSRLELDVIEPHHHVDPQAGGRRGA